MTTATQQPRWGMVVDLNRCVGCQTCTIACKHANDTLPGVQWRSVLDVEHGTFPDVQREFLVVGCQHCAEPSCVPVCPSGATAQRADGMVTMDYDLCIGCGYCAVSCPYQARSIVHEQRWYYGVETLQEMAVAHDERIGVAQKCTFCIERVDEGLALGHKPGVDLDYSPACAASCVASAIHFGDFNDPQSNISRLVAGNASFQMHAELGNDPQIKYLYELDATPGRLPAAADLDDSVLGDPAQPLTGKRQTFWDFRAAMNFILGGMGSGLAALSTAGYFLWDLPQASLLQSYLLSAVLMATGLTFVFMEIGRKLRFLHVLFRPHSSWMTREAYVAGLYYVALLLDWIWPRDWLHVVIGIAAAGFLYSQARILQAAKGIPAWRVPIIPWMLCSSGLLEGTGWYTFRHAINPAAVPIGPELMGLGMLLAVCSGTLWSTYRSTAKVRGIPPLARAVLDRTHPYLIWIGYALPLAGFTILFAFHSSLLYMLSGLAAIAGGAIWKFMVVARASFQQGFSLPRLPQRGSGTRAGPVQKQFVK